MKLFFIKKTFFFFFNWIIIKYETKIEILIVKFLINKMCNDEMNNIMNNYEYRIIHSFTHSSFYYLLSKIQICIILNNGKI